MNSLQKSFVYSPLMLVVLHAFLIVWSIICFFIYVSFPFLQNIYGGIVFVLIVFFSLGSFFSNIKNAKVYQISIFILPLLSVISSVAAVYCFLFSWEALIFAIISIVPTIIFHFLYKQKDSFRTANNIILIVLLIISVFTGLIYTIIAILPPMGSYSYIDTVITTPDEAYSAKLELTSGEDTGGNSIVTIEKKEAYKTIITGQTISSNATVFIGDWDEAPNIIWKDNDTLLIDSTQYDIEEINTYPFFKVK